ncbi:MAG: SDR family oxidoreductase [Acidimicrobiales bacterium]|jgi:NAD(P)-dependent dehydrogenase (short-subunit alcohol dehydrogenase family)
MSEAAGTGLAGRIALVSRGVRGVGRGISEELAAAGATVAIVYHRDADAAEKTAKAIFGAGGTATVHQAAVESFEDCRRLCDEVLGSHGAVDILAANAGIASRCQTVAKTEPAEMERLFGIHVMGAFHLAHLLVPQMRDRPRGDVVMVSSVNSSTNPGRGAPYNVAKSALESLAYTLAKEELRYGTHVNVVAPALVVSEMGRRLVKAAGVDDIHSLDANSPFGHVCDPADVGRIVRFLVSEGAGYVIGQRIEVDGGGSRR